MLEIEFYSEASQRENRHLPSGLELFFSSKSQPAIVSYYRQICVRFSGLAGVYLYVVWMALNPGSGFDSGDSCLLPLPNASYTSTKMSVRYRAMPFDFTCAGERIINNGSAAFAWLHVRALRFYARRHRKLVKLSKRNDDGMCVCFGDGRLMIINNFINLRIWININSNN